MLNSAPDNIQIVVVPFLENGAAVVLDGIVLLSEQVPAEQRASAAAEAVIRSLSN